MNGVTLSIDLLIESLRIVGSCLSLGPVSLSSVALASEGMNFLASVLSIADGVLDCVSGSWAVCTISTAVSVEFVSMGKFIFNLVMRCVAGNLGYFCKNVKIEISLSVEVV